MADIFDELREHMRAQDQELEVLRESVASRALAMEDVNWKSLNGYESDDDGITLESLHNLSEKLRELADFHPLHIRGAQLRHSYVFGRGMEYVDIKPQAKKVVEDAHNAEVLFSMDAYEKANKALFTDGQFTVLRNAQTNRFTSVQVKQITSQITNPDDASDIWFIQRSWTSNKTYKQVWYPTASHRREVDQLPTSIDVGGVNQPVSQDTVAYIKHTKRQTGWTWGIPDSLGAMIYTQGYDRYIHKGLQLHDALSTFAWNLTRQTPAGVNAAAAQVHAPQGGVGGTVVGTGESGAVSSVGVPSAQVNFNNGQPVAALVAASFGVPVIALLSSPGATGGSYGAAETLTDPTLKGFQSIQDSWAVFYHEIFLDLGSKDGKVEFPAISTDAVYRQMTALAQAVELGIIWKDEARQTVLDLMEVTKLHDELPPEPEKAGTVVSKQGVAADGAVAATTNAQGDTNHDGDTE